MTVPSDLQESIIQEFRKQSLEQLEKLKPSDVVVFDNQPIQEKYTIVAHLDETTSNVAVFLQDKFRAIDGEQYYYPVKQLHLTLLGNINITTNHEFISRAVKVAFKKPFEFILFGVAGNQYCASMSAYPHNFSFTNSRKILRDTIGYKGDDYGSILPAYEKVGWINFMRYLHQPKEALTNELKRNNDIYFGEFIVTEVSIYRSKSKILAPDQSELINTITF